MDSKIKTNRTNPSSAYSLASFLSMFGLLPCLNYSSLSLTIIRWSQRTSCELGHEHQRCQNIIRIKCCTMRECFRVMFEVVLNCIMIYLMKLFVMVEELNPCMKLCKTAV